MEKRKTIEEYERLAESLAQARDDASDVANRALRENQALRQELKPLVERLLAGRGEQPASGGILVKMERDRFLGLLSEINEVLTGLMSTDEFSARCIHVNPLNPLELVVRSGVVRLLQDANRYRVQLNEALAKVPNPRPSAARPPRKKTKRKRR